MKNKIMKFISISALMLAMVSAFVSPQSAFARSCATTTQTYSEHTYYYTSCSDGWYVVTHYDGGAGCSSQTSISPDGGTSTFSNC